MDYSLISLTEISLKCHTTFGYKKSPLILVKVRGSKDQTYMAGLIRPPIKGSTYIRRTPQKRGLTAVLI